jgi:putative peptide zinc metalloprotease protein
MYAEITIASVAALVWCATVPGVLNDVCFHLVLMASVSTVLFNANPLMRFDGYYILADLVDIPNLYSDGQLFLRNLGRRYVFGLPTKLSTGSPSRDGFIRVYGVAAFAWRQFVTLALILVAATMFDGAGWLIAMAATMTWLVVPAVRLSNFLIRGNAWEQPSRLRFALLVVPVSCLLIIAANFLPWPGVTCAPAIVEYAPLTILRAGCSGFVRAVHVRSGEHVEQGQLIAKLENRELSSEIRDLELAMEQSRLRARALEQQDELAASQAELEELDSLRKKLEEKQQEANHLTLAAPCAGRVLVRNTESLVGTYMTVGAEIAKIGAETNKEVRVSILQEDVHAFNTRLGSSVRVRLSGGQQLWCELTKLPPKASTSPTHPSLCAPHGGPLEVRTKRDREGGEEVHELLKPRFVGVVSLSPAESNSLRAGQRGLVSLSRGDSIAVRLLDKLHRMFWN